MTQKMLTGFLMIGAISLSMVSAVFSEEVSTATETSEQAQPRASRQPSAAEMQQLMGPMMGEMMSGMLRAMSKTMADPQIAQNFAAFTRNYYKALIAQGFSEEEAMKIVMASGLPSMGAGK